MLFIPNFPSPAVTKPTDHEKVKTPCEILMEAYNMATLAHADNNIMYNDDLFIMLSLVRTRFHSYFLFSFSLALDYRVRLARTEKNLREKKTCKFTIQNDSDINAFLHIANLWRGLKNAS